MDVEAIIFCITIGMIVAFGFVGIGIILGREMGKHERIHETNRCESSEHISCDICSDRIKHYCNSHVGDDDGK